MSLHRPLLMVLVASAGLPALSEDAVPKSSTSPRDAAPAFRSVTCEGTYPRHLQGVCTNDRDAIYWCFTDVLVRTDLDGQVVAKVPVANHHGDLCHHDGKLYVAVNLGAFNRPAGQADSWVYVYDAETLKEVARHATPDVVHGAGGIAVHDGTFLVVGGLPPESRDNVVYAYDADFRLKRKHEIASGYTLMGIQTATFHDGAWWFGCYGDPPVLLKADESFQTRRTWKYDASLGLVGLPDGRFLAASGRCENGRCTGIVRLVVADDEHGLRNVE